MIRVSAMYPSTGGKIDVAYYAGKHMDMVRKLLEPMGLRRAEVDKGFSGIEPGSDAPFAAIGHLYFDSMEDFQKAFGANAAEIMADTPNYTDIQPQFQFSEIL